MTRQSSRRCMPVKRHGMQTNSKRRPSIKRALKGNSYWKDTKDNMKLIILGVKGQIKNRFVSKLPPALVLVCALVPLQIRTFILIYFFLFQKKVTENKLKVRFIFKHNIQAHLQNSLLMYKKH